MYVWLGKELLCTVVNDTLETIHEDWDVSTTLATRAGDTHWFLRQSVPGRNSDALVVSVSSNQLDNAIASGRGPLVTRSHASIGRLAKAIER